MTGGAAALELSVCTDPKSEGVAIRSQSSVLCRQPRTQMRHLGPGISATWDICDLGHLRPGTPGTWHSGTWYRAFGLARSLRHRDPLGADVEEAVDGADDDVFAGDVASL